MMQRLNIAREDPNIRQAISASGFRSQQQAMAEAQMMRAAIMAKAVAGGGAAGAAAGSAAGAAGPSGAAAGAAAGSPASRMAAYPQQQQQQQQQQPSGASPRPFMRTSGGGAGSGGAAAAAVPALPYVFRRAAQDVQITDPSTGDILQLDKGTWVMTAAAAGPTRTLAIYTTDADTGSVLSYEVPLPDGRIASLFDQHTLNPLDTVTIGE